MQGKNELARRNFLIGAGTLAAAPLIGTSSVQAQGQSTNVGSRTVPRVAGRRKLGALEVSSVGLGVQNMSRTYQTTIPTRPEMINIIRTAFDRGVTFFDAAEAYGPHEVERILGEGIAPFRDKVVITSKFGWNIDQETGERRPGLNSRPDHIKRRGRGHAQAPAHRPHRPALPAPRRPGGADRGRRRRGQGPDGPRQGPALGPVRDGAEHAAPRACRAAGHRRSERIFDAVARAGDAR